MALEKNKICEFTLFTIMTMGFSMPLFSSSYSWFGGTNTNFNYGPNWIEVMPPGSNDYVFFSAPLTVTSNFTVDVNVDNTIQSLLFTDLGTNSGPFIVNVNNGATLTLNGGDTGFAANGASNFGSGYQQTVVVNNGGTLVFANSAMAGGGPQTGELVTYQMLGGTINFNNSSSAGGGNYPATVPYTNTYGTFSGIAGTINFNNSSNGGYAKFNFIGAPSMNLHQTSTLGSATATFTSSSNGINFYNSSDAGESLLGTAPSTINLAISSSGSFNDSSTAGTANINLSSTSTLDFNNSSTAGASTITLSSSSNLNFKNSSFGGTSTINATSSTVNFNNTTSAQASNISLSSSNLNFNNSAVANTAIITINSGSTATFSDMSSASSAQINVNSTGVLNFTDSSSAQDATINVFNGSNLGFLDSSDGGASIVVLNAGFFSTDHNLTIGSLTSTDALPNTSTVDLISNNLTLGSLGLIDSLNANIFSTGGNGSIVKVGTGALTLGGTNSYSISTVIAEGMLLASSSTNLGANTATITFDPASTLSTSSTLQLTASGAITLSQPVSITSSFTGNVNVTNSLANVTLSGQISGGGVLAYTGPGTLTLSSGSNNYSGGTTIANGTLSTSGAGNLGGGSISIASNGVLQSTGTFSASNAVILAAGSTIDVSSGQNLTLGGSLSGIGGSLTKTSAGTLTLSAANTYTSGTMITDGTLSVSVLGALGSGNVSIAAISTLQSTGTFSASNTVTLAAGSTIDVTSGHNFTLSNTVSGAGGSLTKTSAGTLTLSGTNTYDSGTFISSGTVSVSSDGNLGSGGVSIGGNGSFQSTGTFSTSKAISIASGSKIDVTSGEQLTITSAISGVLGSLTKINSGTLTLTGANTYTGDTTVVNGKLYVDGSLVSTTTTTVSPSGFLGGNGTVGNLNVQGTVSPGHSVGTLYVNDVEFFSGSTYYVEVDGLVSDKIVAAGNVKINPSSTLDVDPRLATARIYPILTGSSVTGTFKPVDNLFPRFGIDVKYSPQEVDLIIIGGISFPSILPKGDLNKIASCFDLMVPFPSGDMLGILEVLDTLTLPELIDAFDQFNIGFFNSISFGEQSLLQRIREIYTEHAYSLQDPSCCGYNRSRMGGGLWATVLVDQSRNKSQGHSRAYSGYKDKFIGFASGIDFMIRDDLLISSGFAFAKSHMDWTRVDAEAKFNSCNLMVSAAYAPDHFIFDTSFGWLYSPIRASRHILIRANETFPLSISPINKEVKHRNSSNAYNAHIGGAYDFNYIMFKTIHLFLRPFFNVDYMHVHSHGYKEYGGGSLNMVVEAKNSDLLRPEVGLAFGLDSDMSYLSKLDVQVSYIRENRFSGSKTTNSFLLSESCSFNVGGLFPNRNIISPVVKLGMCSTDDIHFDVEYRGLFGNNYAENELRFDFKACF